MFARAFQGGHEVEVVFEWLVDRPTSESEAYLLSAFKANNVLLKVQSGGSFRSDPVLVEVGRYEGQLVLNVECIPLADFAIDPTSKVIYLLADRSETIGDQSPSTCSITNPVVINNAMGTNVHQLGFDEDHFPDTSHSNLVSSGGTIELGTAQRTLSDASRLPGDGDKVLEALSEDDLASELIHFGMGSELPEVSLGTLGRSSLDQDAWQESAFHPGADLCSVDRSSLSPDSDIGLPILPSSASRTRALPGIFLREPQESQLPEESLEVSTNTSHLPDLPTDGSPAAASTPVLSTRPAQDAYVCPASWLEFQRASQQHEVLSENCLADREVLETCCGLSWDPESVSKRSTVRHKPFSTGPANEVTRSSEKSKTCAFREISGAKDCATCSSPAGFSYEVENATPDTLGKRAAQWSCVDGDLLRDTQHEHSLRQDGEEVAELQAKCLSLEAELERVQKDRDDVLQQLCGGETVPKELKSSEVDYRVLGNTLEEQNQIIRTVCAEMNRVKTENEAFRSIVKRYDEVLDIVCDKERKARELVSLLRSENSHLREKLMYIRQTSDFTSDSDSRESSGSHQFSPEPSSLVNSCSSGFSSVEKPKNYSFASEPSLHNAGSIGNLYRTRSTGSVTSRAIAADSNPTSSFVSSRAGFGKAICDAQNSVDNVSKLGQHDSCEKGLSSASSFCPNSLDDLHLGMNVLVRKSGDLLYGIVKWLGRLPNEIKEGWVGVELELPCGNHNGKYDGVQYFFCKPEHGVFVSLSKILLAWR